MKDSNSAAHVSTRLNTGRDARLWRALAHRRLASCSRFGELFVARSVALGLAQQFRRHVSSVEALQLALRARRSRSNCRRNHGSIFVSACISSTRAAALERQQQPVNRVPAAAWRASRAAAIVGRISPARSQGVCRLERADALLQRFPERPADGHHLADRLHLRAQRGFRAGKLLELPLGNLDHHVVDGRLEAGRRFARDVVGNFVELYADAPACAAILAMGNPVALDASAELRETRGFISMTTIRPSPGRWRTEYSIRRFPRRPRG